MGWYGPRGACGCCPCTNTASCIGVPDPSAIDMNITVPSGFVSEHCSRCDTLTGVYTCTYSVSGLFICYSYIESEACVCFPGGPMPFPLDLFIGVRFLCNAGTCIVQASVGWTTSPIGLTCVAELWGGTNAIFRYEDTFGAGRTSWTLPFLNAYGNLGCTDGEPCDVTEYPASLLVEVPP